MRRCVGGGIFTENFSADRAYDAAEKLSEGFQMHNMHKQSAAKDSPLKPLPLYEDLLYFL